MIESAGAAIPDGRLSRARDTSGPHRLQYAVEFWAGCCDTQEEHEARLWFVCENPERPLDDHGIFVSYCAGCERAWKILGCPIPGDRLPRAR